METLPGLGACCPGWNICGDAKAGRGKGCWTQYNITNLQGCKALHAEVLVRLVHLEGVAVIDKLDGS
ncbi:hypothetical protein ACSQ67_026141 [Phaseolus vulgaris]